MEDKKVPKPDHAADALAAAICAANDRKDLLGRRTLAEVQRR